MTDDTYGPSTPAWGKLAAKSESLASTSVAGLFDADSGRGERFCREAAGLYLDFGRQQLDAEAFELLVRLAEQTDVTDWIRRMFAGEPINNTESRAALHVALRRPASSPLALDGENVMRLVESERLRMQRLADDLAAEALTGFTGRPIRHVVNIGIGGSDLGPVMVAEALAEYRNPDVSLHFVSNIDGVAISHVIESIDPETTLFVVCSKSFSTLETLTNARIAREWLLREGGERAVEAQFVAVSTNHSAMDEFGIAPGRRFAIWDWVGGRYSVWSAVGLSVALAIGWERFAEFLAGAHEMDRHFETAALDENLPALLALVGVWNRNFLGAGSHAVLPYDDHLRRLPAYLQQLEMESNGKSVRRNGDPVECATCPIIWGEAGSNAQHSFYQLLHQGTERISLDFILPALSGVGRQAEQDLAALNCLAQSWALASGDPDGSAGDPHQDYPGNRPSTLILFQRLDPATLGRLIALYEHKVFVQGVVWDVNSFDQWGVQLGKRLADRLSGADFVAPAVLSAAVGRLRRLRG